MTERSEEQPINIIFDDRPGPQSGRFVEVEDDQGASIKVGTWKEREDGLWALRITSLRRDKEHKTLGSGIREWY